MAVGVRIYEEHVKALCQIYKDKDKDKNYKPGNVI